MSEADIITISHISLELIHKESLNAESCNATLDVSQDEMQGAAKKSECDSTLYKGDHLSEPLLEDFTYDSEDASEDLTSSLNCGHKAAWELTSPLVIMGESLLDCIVKDSPKEVSIFLTQPTSSLFKTEACFTDEGLLMMSDASNMAEKISDQNGNMTDTEQPTESAEMGLIVSPDPLDENLDYICTLMQSDKPLKEHFKRNLAYCTNREVVSSRSPPEIEKLQEEVEQKAKCMSQCLELDSVLHKKEEEIQELSSAKHKSEQEVSGSMSVLRKMKEDKDSLGKRVTSLQAPLQRQKERRAERKKLVAQIKILQVQSESEQVEMEKMQQQIHTFQVENGELQQQVAKDKNENRFLQAECARWKEQSDQMWQLKKFKADFDTLQEKLQEEVEQKAKYMSQCLELYSILHKKEEEIQELSSAKHKLEQEVSGSMSALRKMKEDKDSLEKRVVSLQASLQRQKERRAERKKLVAQIKILQVQSENEQEEMEKMQQQIHTFQMENGELQQQVAKDKNENRFLQAECARWKEQSDQIKESQALKEKMQDQIIKVLRYKLRLQQEELRKKEEIIAWKMHILGRLHLDMKSVHSDLSTRSPCTEENHFNSPYVQKASNLLSKIHSLLVLTEGLLTCQDSKTTADSSKKGETGIKQKEKTKSHSIKKKTMEEKHKESPAAIHELIIKERPSEGHQTVFKDVESNLASKEEECKTVTEEDKTLQDDLGSSACKASNALQQFQDTYNGTQWVHSPPDEDEWL